LTSSKNELSSRFSRVSADNRQLSSDVSELRKMHSTAMQDIADLQTRIRENRDSIQLSEMISRCKIERAHAAAELEALKMEIQVGINTNYLY